LPAHDLRNNQYGGLRGFWVRNNTVCPMESNTKDAAEACRSHIDCCADHGQAMDSRP
jgi:hypothetical protein